MPGGMRNGYKRPAGAQKAEEVERLKEETELNAAEREEQRYKRELAKYEDNAAALELVEKKHQRNLTKIRLDEIEHRLIIGREQLPAGAENDGEPA